jgi:hypothetical protein
MEERRTFLVSLRSTRVIAHRPSPSCLGSLSRFLRINRG